MAKTKEHEREGDSGIGNQVNNKGKVDHPKIDELMRNRLSENPSRDEIEVDCANGAHEKQYKPKPVVGILKSERP